jgi:hypothetical protein
MIRNLSVKKRKEKEKAGMEFHTSSWALWPIPIIPAT